MLTTDNTTYKDDFNTNNVEDKNYLRILFNGGRSVQIRELNQLQTILQSQIDKFGGSVYKSGARVIGGECTFDRKIHYVSFPYDLIANINNPIDPATVTILSQGIGALEIKADVLGFEITQGSLIVYIRYSSGGSKDTSLNKFNINESITIQGPNGTSLRAQEISFTSGAFLSKGVFFINGSFVVTNKQQIFITRTEFGDQSDVTGKIILEVTENVVNYIADPTLLDNATGSPNFLAPGADRFQVNIKLKFIDKDTPTSSLSRITLLDIVDGNVVTNSKIRYTDLDRQFAQRTFEESGNYTLNRFPIEVSKLVGSGRPGSESPTAAENLYIGLDPSVAYVDGYRIELLNKKDMVAPRATTLESSRISMSLNIGNFIDVSPIASSNSNVPNPLSATVKYELFDSIGTAETTIVEIGKTYRISTVGTSPPFIGLSALNNTKDTFFTASANATLINGNKVIPSMGNCRVKSVETIGIDYRLYLFDIILYGVGNIGNANFFINTGSNVRLEIIRPLQDTSLDTSVFKLPFNTVQSLDILTSSAFSYVTKKVFTGVVQAGNIFTISAQSGNFEIFEDASPTHFVVTVGGVLRKYGLGTNEWAIQNSSTTSISLSIPSFAVGTAISVIFPVKVSSNILGSKTLTTSSTEVIAKTDNFYTLSNSDISSITSVITGSSLNITSDFVIEFDGQTPTKYTNAIIKYVGSGIAPATISVVYRYFNHQGIPFAANSYDVEWSEATALTGNKIRYNQVPSFNGVKLTDCIDFRPMLLANGLDISQRIHPDPNSVLTCNPKFYLPRIDKIIVNSIGEFNRVEGIPKLLPEPPETPPASMCLYELNFAPYLGDPKAVIIKLIDNRRYTMRDISKIEKRLNVLEYYTSLSLIEQSVNEKSIFDGVNGQRFKNGILVDSFAGHSVGNVMNPAYSCSIDKMEGVLRPKFTTDAVDLVYAPSALGSSSVKLNTSTITLPFTEKVLISQPLYSESESVNPYDVASFVGNISLHPATDQWIETNRRPDIILNDTGANDALRLIAEESGILGTEWNNVRGTQWRVTTTAGFNALANSIGIDPSSVRLPPVNPRTSSLSARVGTTTSFVQTESRQNLGDRVIDVSFVPFIRSRRIYFDVKGLKPLTRVYPFFDGIAVSQYARAEASVVRASELQSISEFLNILPNTSGITQSQLISDANGSLIGSLVIPNNSVLKFRTGERKFKLTDSINNSKDTETTFADGTYNANGSVQTIESTILSTQIPSIRTDRVIETRVVRTRWVDPLAQTFIINDTEDGAFLTSLDLFFSHKSTTNIPVTIRIVSVTNGYPTQRSLPFSDVTISPSLVNANPSNSIATKFTFSDPVYVQSGVEYAIVVLSNDPAYKIHVAKLGGIDLNDPAKPFMIQKNPYGGVMFMSQNASTWTADQTRDMKFVLHRAAFTPNTSGSAEFKSIMRAGIQSITINSDTLSKPNTGYVSAPTLTISPPPSLITGIQAVGQPIIDVVSGKVTKILVTVPGSGYNVPPSITLSGGATGAAATANLYSAKASAFRLIQNNMVLKEASIINDITLDGNNYQNIGTTELYSPITTPATISPGNRASVISTLRTTSEFISPVINLDTMAILAIENIINNNITNENIRDDGSALARYITREVELNDPADQLNIYMDVNRPIETSNVILYVKLKYDSKTYSDWIQVEPLTNIKVTANMDNFEEVSYTYNSELNDFISFSVKLVFTSTTSVRVPLVKNLRIVATT